MKKLEMIYLPKQNADQYLAHLRVKIIRLHRKGCENNNVDWETIYDLLDELQSVYAKENDAPLFYMSYKNGYNYRTAKYLVETRGLRATCEYLSSQLVTGCPRTARTWCD